MISGQAKMQLLKFNDLWFPCIDHQSGIRSRDAGGDDSFSVTVSVLTVTIVLSCCTNYYCAPKMAGETCWAIPLLLRNDFFKDNKTIAEVCGSRVCHRTMTPSFLEIYCRT